MIGSVSLHAVSSGLLKRFRISPPSSKIAEQISFFKTIPTVSRYENGKRCVHRNSVASLYMLHLTIMPSTTSPNCRRGLQQKSNRNFTHKTISSPEITSHNKLFKSIKQNIPLVTTSMTFRGKKAKKNTGLEINRQKKTEMKRFIKAAKR